MDQLHSICATGGTDPSPTGTINGNLPSEVYIESFKEAGIALQSLSVGYNLVAVGPTQAIFILEAPVNVSLSAIVPSSATDGETATMTFTLEDLLGSEICTSSVTVVVASTCSQKVTEWNGTMLTATWDGAIGACFIEDVPAPPNVTRPFIYNNAYYIIANESTCVPGFGTWDGANCEFEAAPHGGWLWQNSFFVPSVGTSSASGTYVSPASCLVKTAPWGTHAFVYPIGGQPYWYFTPLFTCRDGGYDGANCYIVTAPAGTKALLYNNAFYYQ